MKKKNNINNFYFPTQAKVIRHHDEVKDASPISSRLKIQELLKCEQLQSPSASVNTCPDDSGDNTDDEEDSCLLLTVTKVASTRRR